MKLLGLKEAGAMPPKKTTTTKKPVIVRAGKRRKITLTQVQPSTQPEESSPGTYARVTIGSAPWVQGVNASQIAAGAISSGRIVANTITANKIAVQAASSYWDEIKEQALSVPPVVVASSEPDVEPAKPKRIRKKETLEFTQEELDQAQYWTTAQAAWFCGMSRSAWHVHMHKHGSLHPVQMGRGKGQQNFYLPDDVRKFRTSLGRD